MGKRNQNELIPSLLSLLLSLLLSSLTVSWKTVSPTIDVVSQTGGCIYHPDEAKVEYIH